MMVATLSIHGNAAQIAILSTTPQLILRYLVPGIGWIENRRLAAEGIMAKASLTGQGNTSNPFLCFDNGHAGVRIPALGVLGEFYDPSYGVGPFDSKILWEDAVLDKHRFNDPGHQDPGQPEPGTFYYYNVDGVLDTCAPSITVDSSFPPPATP